MELLLLPILKPDLIAEGLVSFTIMCRRDFEDNSVYMNVLTLRRTSESVKANEENIYPVFTESGIGKTLCLV
ncbi:hypothetical protein CAL7716_005920 [Calothrix sp. PCC 7716]|nr:hypothetical protein CAL7716_005920 [Calothrix sp. PCC 7716]